jgi:SAM-dependent methyltransferase
MSNVSNKTEFVKEYYGKALQGKIDLKTNACCCSDELLHPVILGCGTGKDVFIASRLVGPDGFVTGIDMTDEQIEVAQRHVSSHAKKFGYSQPNVNFIKGYIEDLKTAGIEDNSIDVVMSNCVLNLSTNKETVFSEIFRVLKPGGELYFSDVFTGRRVSESLQDDPLLHSECLGGAMYIEDFRRMLRNIGCLDYRVVTKKKIKIGNPKIEVKVGMIDFYSMTVRAFNLNSLEDLCEDYGQVAVYRGTIPGYSHAFDLDEHHRFIAGKPMLVCGNTASMLSETRYGKHFNVTGDRSVHYGWFDCAPASEKHESEGEGGGACC